MGSRRRLRRTASGGILAAFALIAGCGRTTPPDAARGTTTTARPSASARGPDQLAPGELLEGASKAFGVSLPRDLHVDGSFADVVYASGPLGVHSLVQFFRARLEDGSLREGPQAATFEHVHIPGDPGRELLVSITQQGSGCRVDLRDSTPLVLPVAPDDSARWRQVGLTPQGKLADPTHLN
jgi:hypothetical protein